MTRLRSIIRDVPPSVLVTDALGALALFAAGYAGFFFAGVLA